jgi:outer membrane protein TolC
MTIRGWLVLSLALGVSAPLSAQVLSDSTSHAITLPEAIALAQQRGHQARAARATREGARYRHRAYRSGLLPQLFLGGNVPSYNKSIIAVLQDDGSTVFVPQQQTDASLTLTLSQKIPVTGGDLFVQSSLARLHVSGVTAYERWSSTPVSVGVRQDLFRPNAAAWAGREDAAQAELDERAYLEAMEDVALQTTTAFYDLYAARVGLANAVTNAAVNDTLYRLNTGRFEVGKIGENDLLQSELVLLRSRSALATARLEHERATDALRLALDLPWGTPLDVTVTGEVPEFEADTARAVAEALKNRAAVSAVALDEVQARRGVAEARLRSGAGATLQASYGFNATGPEANLAYQNLLEARHFTFSVQVPLWQWGAHAEGVHAAEANRDRVASLSQGTMGQVAHDARFAALELAQARRNFLLAAKADSVAAKRFEVAYNRYVIGRITIDNLYIAQAEKDQALLQYVQALRGYWGAHYQLRRATLFDFAAGRPIRG